MARDEKKEILKTLALPAAVVAVVAAAWLFIGPVVVTESSMEPTLHDGQYVLVQKHLYGAPEPGDIVIFKNDKSKKKRLLVKRVIGVAGDVIELKNGNVYRNKELLKESYASGDTFPESGSAYASYEVTDGALFVLGDNRENSVDSRVPGLGLIKTEKVIGKVLR